MKKRAGVLIRNRWTKAVLLAAPPIALWGLLAHAIHWRPRTLHAGYKLVTTLEFSPDGRTLAVAGWGGAKGEEVQLWEVASGRLRQTLHAPQSIFVASLVFSRDGKRLASGGTSIYLWNVQSGQLQRDIANANDSASLTVIGFSPDDGSLVCGRLEGPIEAWDIKSATLKRRLAISATSPCRLHFTAQDEVLIGLCGVSARGFEIQRWNLKTGAARSKIIGNPHDASLPGFTITAIAPDWKTLAVARGDEVRLWNVGADNEAKRHILRLQPSTVTALAVSADSATLAVADSVGTIKLWDVRAGRVSHTIQETQGRITALAFSPDDGILAIAHRSGSVRLRRLK